MKKNPIFDSCSMVRLVAVLVFSMLSGSNALATVLKVTVLTPSARTYEPISVRADFDGTFCLSSTTPKYSSLKLDGDLLTVRLSHLKADTCVSSHTVELPGLPTGHYRIKIATTASRFVQPAVVAESYEASSAEIAFTVAPFFVEEFARSITCARTGATGVRYLEANSGCVKPLFQPSSVNDAPLEIDAWTPEGKGAFAYRIFRNGQGGGANFVTSGVPEAFTQLMSVNYPSPLNGRVITTSVAECQGLAAAWGVQGNCDVGAWVLKLVNGACPLGATRVYRLFHPVAVEHRYTQEEGILPLLVKSGYIVEGAVFCAPA